MSVGVFGGIGASFVAPPAGGWSPTDYAGLHLWLDASQLSYADGTSVTQWDDLSGNNLHATQYLTRNLPTFVSAAANGSPAVRFAGSHALVSQANSKAGNQTVLAVARIEPTKRTLDNPITGGSANAPNGGLEVRINSSTVAQVITNYVAVLVTDTATFPTGFGVVAAQVAGTPAERKYNVLASSELTPALDAIDGRTDTVWHSQASPTPHWFRLEPAVRMAATSLTIRTRAGRQTYHPVAFNIEGSMDGATWTLLGQESGVVWAGTAETKTFTFQNTTGWTHYRLYCTQPGASGYLELATIFLDDVEDSLAWRSRVSTDGDTAVESTSGHGVGVLQTVIGYNGGNYLWGDIAELIVINETLSDAEIVAASQALLAKWAAPA